MPGLAGRARHLALGTRHEGTGDRKPSREKQRGTTKDTKGTKGMMYKMLCQKKLCVPPSSVGLRVQDGVLGGEGLISSSISMRVILIGAALGGRKRIGENGLRRFWRPGISDRVLLLSAYWKRT